MTDKQLLGSQTAKGGFANEKDICKKFSNWQHDEDAQKWLKIMDYELTQLKNVTAIHIPTRLKKSNVEKYSISADEYEKFARFKKADIQIKLIIQVAEILKIENLSLKKANLNANFNQIDKRTVDNYQQMWKFDDEIAFWLKLFAGELLAKNYPEYFASITLREPKRIHIDEMPLDIQEKILDFFDKNRILVASDILKGRGGLSADWILVTRLNKVENTTDWILKDINTSMNFYGMGKVRISPKGSLFIGRFFMQRKGGTPDPTKLQFKFKPCDLFELT
jgi:hypothetical protein